MRLGRTVDREVKATLRALVSGYELKSHRYLDGQKLYTLHDTATDATRPVHVTTVDHLRDRGLIVGNMKFPAATYMLTPEGARVAASLTPSPLHPLLARFFPGREIHIARADFVRFRTSTRGMGQKHLFLPVAMLG